MVVVHQREIVEVPFDMPDGRILPHMALVLSADDLQDYEEGLFYAVLISSKNHFPELTIPIDNGWLNKPLSKQSYFVTHIVKDFNVDDVISRYNNFIKAEVFPSLVKGGFYKFTELITTFKYVEIEFFSALLALFWHLAACQSVTMTTLFLPSAQQLAQNKPQNCKK